MTYVNPWLNLRLSEPEPPYVPTRRGKTKLQPGDKVGKWTLVEYMGAPSRNGAGKWRCECDCGNVRLVHSHNLNRGESLSCGCSQYERAKGYGRGKSELGRVR